MLGASATSGGTLRRYLDGPLMHAFWLIAVGAAVLCFAPVADAQPARNLKDLEKHFAACFAAPREPHGSRLTFYFSLTKNGQIIGSRPRTVWFGLQASKNDRDRLLDKVTSALMTDCFPVSLNREMARLIPGDVLFLQFAASRVGTTVFLGPYGSHVPPDWLYGRW